MVRHNERWSRLTGTVAGFTLLSLCGLGTSLVAGGKKSDAEVKVSATAGKIDPAGLQIVTVTLDINKGWHIYANPVGNDDLGSAQTVLTVKAAAKPAVVTVMYPPGKVKEDKIVGNYNYYQDKIVLKASVKRASGDTSPLELNVRFQACNKNQCLLPAQVKLTIP